MPPSGLTNAKPSVMFAVRFALIAGALFALYGCPYAENGISETWFTRYLSAYASLAGGVLSLFEPGVSVSGTQIVGRTALQIVKNCDALEINALFASAILAFPGPWRRRSIALVSGIAVLVVANVTRICSLYYLNLYSTSAFEFFHLELWPLVLVVITALNFLGWAGWIQHHDATPARTPSPRTILSSCSAREEV